uniref:Tubby-like F-box protein n=1 Tax=Kalanchoe fedtschenkoi TaxID=63787 RepID=A0A7N0TXN9_KALFE
MVFKRIWHELKEIRDGIGSKSRRVTDRKHFRTSCGRSHIAPELCVPSLTELVEQGQWENLPPELLLDIMNRVEASETQWPARRDVVACASVCSSWRDATKEIVKPLELCGWLTFPISLKQPGPRDQPIQCYIKRERATSVFRLYLGLGPGNGSKMLLAAKKVRRTAHTEFLISLDRNDFSRTSNMYVGKLRSNFLGTKFTIFDSQISNDLQKDTSTQRRGRPSQVSPNGASSKSIVATVSYELNILRTRGPRRMHCFMHSIPFSAIQEGGTAPTPTEPLQPHNETYSGAPDSKGKSTLIDFSSTSLIEPSEIVTDGIAEPLILENKTPRWHEQLQCWCLNFKGRVTVASVKNFQLVASVEPHQDVPAAEQEKVILQFGKIGKDIFTMDYRYPLSAFQAFAICLSSFDTKPACE